MMTMSLSPRVKVEIGTIFGDLLQQRRRAGRARRRRRGRRACRRRRALLASSNSASRSFSSSTAVAISLIGRRRGRSGSRRCRRSACARPGAPRRRRSRRGCGWTATPNRAAALPAACRCAVAGEVALSTPLTDEAELLHAVVAACSGRSSDDSADRFCRNSCSLAARWISIDARAGRGAGDDRDAAACNRDWSHPTTLRETMLVCRDVLRSADCAILRADGQRHALSFLGCRRQATSSG